MWSFENFLFRQSEFFFINLKCNVHTSNLNSLEFFFFLLKCYMHIVIISCNSGLRKAKGVYNLIEVISNEPNK
jgi:hypothetical protein